MRIHNLYADHTGESHFRDVYVAWSDLTPSTRSTAGIPITQLIFREVPGSYDLDWHPAPCRQFVVNLDAAVEVTASDGEVRVIGKGEILLVEDTSGRGHRSKAVEGTPRRAIFLTLE